MIVVFQELGYFKVSKLDFKGLEWMFENEVMLLFLEWFCNSVSIVNFFFKVEVEQ